MDRDQAMVTTQAADLAGAYADYVAFLDANPRTVNTYKGNLRQFFRWLQEHEIQSPTYQDLLSYKRDLMARCKPTTVTNYICAVRLFFEWTEISGIYPNISRHVKGAKLDNSFKKDPLAAHQVASILDAIDTKTAKGKRDRAIVALMAADGLRDVEISRANLEDLRQANGSAVLYLQGKGHDERTEFVKVVPEVERMLRAYLKTRPGAKGKDPLFVSQSNNSRDQRLSPRTVSKIVKNRLVDAGYNSERLTAHSLRHTAVTCALLGGLPIEEVRVFARHRSIDTTLRYAHHLQREKNRSEDTIASLIFAERRGDNGKDRNR